MPEAGASYVPRPLTFVESDPLTEALAGLLRLAGNGHRIAGLAATHDGLTLHIAPGQAMVLTDDSPASVYYVKLTAQVDKLLVNAATNHVYLTYQADIVVNQSGTQPADSMKLYTVITAGGAVSSVTPEYGDIVDLAAKLRTQGLDLSGFELTNLGAPTVPSSAARQQDLNDALSNLKAIKNPVRAATTTNLAALSGLLTIDGVILVSQDRVLVKNQSAPSQNGIYVALTGAWTRATDFDASAEVIGGALVAVSEGTVNGGAVFGMDTDDPITLGTTGLTFVRKDVLEHAAATAAHGADEAATPSRIPIRGVGGTFNVGNATAASHPATKGQVDAAIATEVADRLADVNAEEAARISADSAEAAARANGDAAAEAAAIAFARQRANHTGTQPASTISDFSAAVTAHRLDQMTAPTGPVSMNNQKITNLAAPTDPTDAVRKGYVDAYARADPSAALNVGDVIWEGELRPGAFLANGNLGVSMPVAVGPGVAGITFPANPPLVNQIIGLVTMFAPFGIVGGSTTVTPEAGIAFAFIKGTKTSVKGRYLAFADTPLVGTFERFGVILMRADGHTHQTSGDSFTDVFSETEGTRDNRDAIGFVVNDAEQVKRYNSGLAGDASYSDPASGALAVDLTAGMWFEFIVEIPSAADSMNDAIVTITVNGNAVYTNTNPAAISTTGGLIMLACFNQTGLLSKLYGKIQRAA